MSTINLANPKIVSEHEAELRNVEFFIISLIVSLNLRPIELHPRNQDYNFKRPLFVEFGFINMLLPTTKHANEKS